jgi:hypothetical protein
MISRADVFMSQGHYPLPLFAHDGHCGYIKLFDTILRYLIVWEERWSGNY